MMVVLLDLSVSRKIIKLYITDIPVIVPTTILWIRLDCLESQINEEIIAQTAGTVSTVTAEFTLISLAYSTAWSNALVYCKSGSAAALPIVNTVASVIAWILNCESAYLQANVSMSSIGITVAPKYIKLSERLTYVLATIGCTARIIADMHTEKE